MPETNQQVVSFLHKLNLFDGVSDTQLDQLSTVIEPVTMHEAESLDFNGKDCPFLIIVTGTVRFTILSKGVAGESYLLNQSDFCGADVVFRGKPKDIRLTALNAVLIFSIPVDPLRFVLNTTPALTKNIKHQLAWYNLIRSKSFAWLGEEETVKVVCRKHPAYLLVIELAPLVVAWVGVFILLFASQIATASFRLATGWFGAAVVGMACLWAIYRFIDWGNDYYIITDERVVWLERMVGVYDSRQEAPLIAIKSGETKSGQLGRWLGFGDVITETFMGQIIFRHVGNPAQIKNIVDHEHKVALERQTATDIRAIEEKIRQKIEPSQAATVPMAVNTLAQDQQFTSSSSQEMKNIPEKLSLWQSLLARFQTRREANGMITYRKHVYVLFRMTILPAACAIGALFFTILLYDWRLNEKISLLTPGLILLGGLALCGLAFIWWLYRFIDWSNDVYRLTPEKIIDSERRPLGDEVSKSAPLENIIGLDYERNGFLGVVLNFGNVVINIGTENKFIFYGIPNPARAQRDIFNFMNERRRKKLQSDTLQEQERISNYMAAYHRQAEDIRQAKKPPQI
jgi:hypothetical protein